MIPVKSAQLPIEYEEACKLLAECRTIDDTKYWSDRAEALAAWAKIYHSPKATLEAKRLKLHAHRRMGSLALELRPRKPIKGGGLEPGAVSLLQEHGFQKRTATDMTALGKMAKDKFDKAVQSPRPPSPSNLVRGMRRKENRYYDDLMTVAAIVRKYPPIDAANSLGNGGLIIKRAIKDIVEWFDELDRRVK